MSIFLFCVLTASVSVLKACAYAAMAALVPSKIRSKTRSSMVAKLQRKRVGGRAVEERHGWSRAENGELDVPAAEPGLNEDAANNLDGGESLGGDGLVVEVEGVRVVVLVGLGALDGSHEGLGDGGLVGVGGGRGGGGGDRGEPIEGNDGAKVEGLELDAWGRCCAGEGVAKEGRCDRPRREEMRWKKVF
uniref:DUF834 domain-containing protein n=1 Tax=Oryza glumipatula TaxID=40148 RepID=A0A0E0A4M9_9ORYZ